MWASKQEKGREREREREIETLDCNIYLYASVPAVCAVVVAAIAKNTKIIRRR